MRFGESDTRAKLIDPALHARGWTEDLIRREETAGAVEIVGNRPRRRARGRVDYTLRVKVNAASQAVAVALLEAKAEHLPPAHGLEQAKAYAACRRLNVAFAFASNGHQFVEFDHKTGITATPRPLSEPIALRARYEQAVGFSLESPAARPLLARYPGGEATRRYYQDAAIRAVLEKLALGEKRALLALATGSGKTFIAVHLLKKIADAGQLRRALFVCDRDELRAQGLGAFQNVFGADAAAVSSGTPQKGVLFRTNETAFVQTKRKLLDECDLWCILSLPAGAFVNAGAGVKTNLLFFTKGRPTERIWYYDLSDVKVGKKLPLTLEKFEEFSNLLPARTDGEHSWTVERKEIEARGYDLKAVNPHAKKDEDTRTPEELLDLIEAKGREVTDAIAALRKML